MPLDYNNVTDITSSYRSPSLFQIWTFPRIRAITIVQWLVPLAAVLPVHMNMEFTMKYIKYDDENTLRLETDKESTEVTIGQLWR